VFHLTKDELFDGLADLEQIVLKGNNISSIGLHVFAADANLLRLQHINLEANKLQELEPWPMIRGQLVPGTEIVLDFNQVSTFSNRLRWHFKCGTRPPVVARISLRKNCIRHVTDVLYGWNLTSK
jgi:hypothetical protein